MTRDIGILSILVTILFVTTVSAAQNTPAHQGKLTGQVTDPAGATLLKARVLLVDLTTLGTQKVEVQPDGRFTFSNLEAGRYAVIAVPAAKDGSPECWLPAIKDLTLREDVSDRYTAQALLGLDEV